MAKRPPDRNQFDFHFHFGTVPESRPVEGGSQENLSDFEFHMRRVLKQSVDDCGRRETDPLDRFEIAARMSRKLGREITKSHIDQWAAMSTVQRRIHIDALKALCEVTGDWAPLHALVESCGFKALRPDEAAAAEYGVLELLKRRFMTSQKEILNAMDEDALLLSVMKRSREGGK